MFDLVHRFFVSWRFPAIAISILVSYATFLIGVLLAPNSLPLVEEFKIWCFGYDSATGGVEWGYVWMFLVQPFIMAGLVAVMWWTPLLEGASESPARVLRYGGAGVMLVAILSVGLFLGNDETATIAAPELGRLRVSHAAAPFEFVNQDGDVVSLEDLRGKVVLLTAVYSRCGLTCPVTLREAGEVAGGLELQERDDLTIAVLTLDPEFDTQEIMSRLASTHGLETPLFQFLSGDAAEVGRVLDSYEFSRWQIPSTNDINHTNVAVLIDRDGEVAFRLPITAGQKLVTEAVRILLRERRSGL